MPPEWSGNSPSESFGVVIFQYSSIPLAPTDGKTVSLNQTPAFFAGGQNITVEIPGDLLGSGREGDAAAAAFQPQGQCVGWLKTTFFAFTQLKAGAQDLQLPDVGHFRRRPV